MLVIPLDGFALGFVLLVGLIALVAVLRQRRRLAARKPDWQYIQLREAKESPFAPIDFAAAREGLSMILNTAWDVADHDELMPVPVTPPAPPEPEVVPPAAAPLAPEMLETTSATTALSYFAGTATSPDGVALHSVPMTAHQRIPCGCLLKTRPCQCRFCPMDGAHPIRVVPCHEHRHLAGEELIVADPVLERIKRQK